MNREFHELTFEKGILEAQEASMVPLGFASVLENWQPEPQGNLRCRTGWKNTVTSGAPATRKTRGIGFLATQTLFQTPARVQSASASGTGANASATPTWTQQTIAGNLLILVVGFKSGSSQNASAVTLTATGWTLAKRQDAGAQTSREGIAIYYKANASAESGAVTVTTNLGAGGDPGLRAFIAEYSGVLAASPLDKVAGTSGTSTATADTGSTATTAQTDELWIGAFAVDNLGLTYSGQSSGFGELFDSTGTAVEEKVATATAAAQCTATISSSAGGVSGAIATFKAASATGETARGDYLIANMASSTTYSIYNIEKSQLLTGSYAAVDSGITVTQTGAPIAFAAGLGGILYTHYGFSTLRRWAGGSGAALSGTPAGRAIAFHKNRFFVGGTTAAPSRLWFSALGDHTVFWDTGASETDLASSTFYIDVAEDDGETIEDLAIFADGILIAKTTSLHYLSGDNPSNFVLEKLNTGGGFAGRCICITPYGAVIAAEDSVWLWSGGGVELISKPIESSYSISGDFVSCAYVDGMVYICDEGDGTIYAFNIVSGVWHVESVSGSTEVPAFVFSRLQRLLMGPQAATTGSLLSYRDFPQARGRDANTAMTFLATTPELVLTDPSRVYTPRNLHLQIRQHGGDSTETGLTVTPTLNGSAIDALTIAPQNSAGVFRKTIGVGSDQYGKGITTLKLAFSQTVASTEDSLFDIEAAILELDVEEKRG